MQENETVLGVQMNGRQHYKAAEAALRQAAATFAEASEVRSRVTGVRAGRGLSTAARASRIEELEADADRLEVDAERSIFTAGVHAQLAAAASSLGL